MENSMIEEPTPQRDPLGRDEEDDDDDDVVCPTCGGCHLMEDCLDPRGEADE
jgi:hypothetical protein